MPLTRSAAGKPWSLDVAAECGVTIEQYPAPRACAAIGDECGLGHPYNCRRYLSEVAGMTPTLVQPSAAYDGEEPDA